MPFGTPGLLVAAVGRKCAHCGKYGAKWRCEVMGPDDSWECYRYWCNVTCHANWSTHQPVKKCP